MATTNSISQIRLSLVFPVEVEKFFIFSSACFTPFEINLIFFSPYSVRSPDLHAQIGTAWYWCNQRFASDAQWAGEMGISHSLSLALSLHRSSALSLFFIIYAYVYTQTHTHTGRERESAEVKPYWMPQRKTCRCMANIHKEYWRCAAIHLYLVFHIVLWGLQRWVVTLVGLKTVQGDLNNTVCNLFQKPWGAVPLFFTYDHELCSDFD